MQIGRHSRLILAAILLLSFAGCTRDPNVRKQKYFDSGTRYFQQQKYQEASIQFQNALQIDPRFADAHYQLAQSYARLGIWNGAYVELLRTIDLAPKNWEARIALGNILLAARELKRAQEQAQLVLDANPTQVDAIILLANTYAALEDPQAAVRQMQEAIRLAPNRALSYVVLAQIQATSKQTQEAEESFKKALQLDPKSVPAVLALGNFYRSQQRWPESEQQYRHAIELDPKNPQPRNALSQLLWSQGKKAEAEQALADAKKAMPDNSEGYRMLGDFYFRTGDIDKALAEYASLYQEHSKDLKVEKNYIQLLIVRGRLEEAAKLNDQILKASPKDVDGQVLQGQILIAQKRPTEAIAILQTALRSEPGNTQGHYQLGLAYSRVGNMAQAESEWRETVRLSPSMILAQKALAELAMRRGDADLLSSSAEQIINAEPFSPDGYVLRASARSLRKNPAGAEADLKKAIEVAPENPLGYTQLGNFRARQRQYAEAGKLFEQVLAQSPKNLDALSGMVTISLSQNQPARALARVNAQIIKVPEVAAFYFLKGTILVRTRDWANAEAALQKATELDKDNVNAMLLLGQVQGARGSVDKALASCARAVQDNPRDVRSYLLMGILEDSRGNWQKAQEVYQKALQVQPDNPLAANNLAFSMLEHGGNADVALSYAQVARRAMPDLAGFADTLGWAYYHKATYASAVELLEEAVKKSPQDPGFQYHLGMAYQQMGKGGLAKQHLQRALQLNPKLSQAPEIQDTLAKLAEE